MQRLISFNMFQEACALLPQLYLMRKLHEVEALTESSSFRIDCKQRIVDVLSLGNVVYIS